MVEDHSVEGRGLNRVEVAVTTGHQVRGHVIINKVMGPVLLPKVEAFINLLEPAVVQERLKLRIP